MYIYLEAAPNKPPPRLGTRYTIEVKGLWKLEILRASGGSKIRFCAALGAQDPPKTCPKSTKINKNQLLEGLGAHDPPRPHKDPLKGAKVPPYGAKVPSIWGQNSPKFTKNRSEADSKGEIFFDRFLDRF